MEKLIIRKLPIGIQSFEKLRSEGFLYVDKTEYIYRLAHNNVPYILVRPRRFGKSLLISAMKAYWEGKKELFHNLAIEKLEENNADAWKKYPVFYFDFNGANYQSQGALEEALNIQLKRWEASYGIQNGGESLSERFQNLLIAAKEQTELRSVVLIDEYDKPLLDVIENAALQNHNKEVFKGFFSTLKSFDEYIQFVFITGATKFHKVSIFSDLNQLNDISLNEDYAALCGITEDELRTYFKPEIETLASKQNMTVEECLEVLKEQYDGYHFHPHGNGIYNPFSLLKAFFEKDFGAYWFETGTPSFLVRKLRESEFDVRRFSDHTLYASESQLKDYSGDIADAVPLLYQTGYLTIAEYDRNGRVYTLAFPNQEVKYGFLESLMPAYVDDCGAGSGKDIFTLRRYAENGDLESIMRVLTAPFASIPYTNVKAPFEHYFQTVIYLTFTLLGKFTMCEMHTYNGRIACYVTVRDYIYLFEFKRDGSAEDALKQIDENEYSLTFAADERKPYKIGVSFDSEKRILKEWKAAG